MRRLPLVIFAASMLLAAADGRAQDPKKLADIGTLVRYFDIIAFGNEFTGKRFARVRK